MELLEELELLEEDELLLLVAEAFTAFLEYSAVWVFLPALPSAVSLLARWKAFTASAVPRIARGTAVVATKEGVHHARLLV